MLNARAILRPKTTIETMVASVLVWNPLIAFAICFVLGGMRAVTESFGVSLAIAETTALSCFAGTILFQQLESLYYARKKLPPPKRKIGFYFFLSALLMPLSLPLGFAVGSLVAARLGIEWRGPDSRSYRIGIAFGAIIMAIFFLRRTRSEAREVALAAEARIRDLENKSLVAQLATLTSEMNPHLLFNALNTVAALIPENPERAEEVVLQLSELYRGVLRTSGRAVHSLRDELRLCNAYIEVEKARFGERLTASIHVGDTIDADKTMIPILVLQPFVENAIKHGILPRTRGGRVTVDIGLQGEHVHVVVADDGVGIGHSESRGAGRAIDNCRERLLLTYGKEATLEIAPRDGGGTQVTFDLPLSPMIDRLTKEAAVR